MAGRLPKANGDKAKAGAQGLRAEAMTAAKAAGVRIPTTLGRWGREEWGRVIAGLVPHQNLAVIDLGALEMMCREFENWKLAELEIERREAAAPGTGVYQLSPNGYKQMSAERVEANRAQKEYRKWGMLFGATPVARIRTNGTAQGDLFDWGSRERPESGEGRGAPDPTDPYAPRPGVRPH